MAIDNLYFKCQTGVIRIKHKEEEFIEEDQTKNKKNKKVEDKNKSKKQGDAKGSLDEENIEMKCRLATRKLKAIFAYTKDYRSILE